MNTFVIYESMSGNTKKIAEAIGKACGAATPVLPLEEGKIPNDGLLFVGFWTDKGTCPQKTKEMLSGLHNRQIALFGTAGFGGAEEYFISIMERVCELVPKDNQILGTFMCQGKMPGSVKARYESLLKEHPDDQRMKASLDNFDRALSHPDCDDLESATAFAGEILKKRQV